MVLCRCCQVSILADAEMMAVIEATIYCPPKNYKRSDLGGSSIVSRRLHAAASTRSSGSLCHLDHRNDSICFSLAQMINVQLNGHLWFVFPSLSGSTVIFPLGKLFQPRGQEAVDEGPSTNKRATACLDRRRNEPIARRAAGQAFYRDVGGRSRVYF